MHLAGELGSKSWCILDVCLDTGFFFSPMVNCHVLCLRYLCSVCMYKETESVPCDYSSQLADLGDWWQKCSWRFSLHLCVWGWGCIGDKLTKGHQFRTAMAALQNFVWYFSNSAVIWKFCPSEQGQLLWTSSTMWSQSRYAVVVTRFVGRSLGPASYRAVVLGGLGLAWNGSCQEQPQRNNWFGNCDIDFGTTNRVSGNRTWESVPGVI